MTTLKKSPRLTIHPADKNPYFVNQSNIIDNQFLLDDKNFARYNRKIAKYISDKERNRRYVITKNIDKGLYVPIPQLTIAEYIDQLIQQDRLPHDYHRRLILRQLAQGVYIKPDILAQHDIVIFEGEALTIQRREYQNRQPTSPFDFVLIDPAKWGDYEPLQRFYTGLPDKPYCAIAKDGQALILPKDKAINLAYIQPCHPLYTHCIVFDVDMQAGRDGFTAWRDYNLPPPNIIVKNPTKDSYHYIYLLALPIGKGGKSSKKPIIKLDHIYERMRVLLGADPSYAGNRMKNPFSRKHDCFVSGAEPYTLDDLADKLDFPDPADLPKPVYIKNKPAEPHTGYLGRNHAIFEAIRWIGYKHAHMGFEALQYFLLAECEQYNQTHYSHDPLPANELWHIANSIAKFCKSNRFTYTPEVRAKRTAFARQNAIKSNVVGACKKGGLARSATYTPKRTQAHAMWLQGVKIADIAKQLAVTRQTLHNWGITKKSKM